MGGKACALAVEVSYRHTYLHPLHDHLRPFPVATSTGLWSSWVTWQLPVVVPLSPFLGVRPYVRYSAI